MAFVNLQRLLDLNADQGDAMAQKSIEDSDLQKLNTSAEYSAMWRQGGLNNGEELAGRVQQAQARAATMSGAAGAAAGVRGAGGLDGALMQQSGVMKQAQARSNNLSKLMAGANTAYDAQQRQKAANNRFAGMTQEADAHHAQQQQAEQDKINAATKGYTNANKRWQPGRYDPKGASEYTDYSNYIQRGGR